MTYKSKNIALIVSFILILILSYKLAISKTLTLKNEYHTLKTEALLFKNTPKQLSLLKRKQIYYDSLLHKYQIKGTSVQNNLLKTINTFTDNKSLKVVRFLEPHTFKKNGLVIKTHQFTLEGDYNDVLKLIHHLEQQTKFGEIINLHFQKKKNFKTGKFYLQANVILKSCG